MLVLNHVQVSVNKKRILKDINLEIPTNKIIALMGPNGSGKSTLANTIMGYPKYDVQGTLFFEGEDITALGVTERAKKGLFLSFQYPVEVPGVSFTHFLRSAYIAQHGKIRLADFKNMLKEKMELLKMNEEFAKRNVNEGFSGGEKKKAELLQLAVLQPKLAILDEADSGMDVDALNVCAEGIKKLHKKGMGVLVITHYDRVLQMLQPDIVYVMHAGSVVKKGDAGMAKYISEQGYASV